MTITPEQVADLIAGDIVRLTGHSSLNGGTIEGPLYENETGQLCVGNGLVVREADGTPNPNVALTLAIVTLTDRPVYENHARTEPIGGDVVRSTDATDVRVWMYDSKRFIDKTGNKDRREDLPAELVLIVDGETGTVVP